MRNKYLKFDIGIFTIYLFSSIPQVPHLGVSSYEMAYHTQTCKLLQTLYTKKNGFNAVAEIQIFSLNY